MQHAYHDIVGSPGSDGGRELYSQMYIEYLGVTGVW